LLRGDGARLQNLLVVVNVVNEGVSARTRCFKPLSSRIHSSCGNTAAHIEGDQPLGAFFLAVHGKVMRPDGTGHPLRRVSVPIVPAVA